MFWPLSLVLVVGGYFWILVNCFLLTGKKDAGRSRYRRDSLFHGMALALNLLVMLTKSPTIWLAVVATSLVLALLAQWLLSRAIGLLRMGSKLTAGTELSIRLCWWFLFLPILCVGVFLFNVALMFWALGSQSHP